MNNKPELKPFEDQSGQYMSKSKSVAVDSLFSIYNYKILYNIIIFKEVKFSYN